MAIFLIVLGILVAAGALLFWLYLNGLASIWNTSGRKRPVRWRTGEAMRVFWLPFIIGIVLAVIGLNLR